MCMKSGEYTFARVVGDVYIFDVTYNKSEGRKVARIGSPQEAEMFLDSGTGKLLMHFLEHPGEFFDAQTLSQVTGLKPVSLLSYLGTLDSRFSNSVRYQMLARTNGAARIYGLVERGKGVEGEPVRNKCRHSYNKRSLDSLFKRDRD